jgi:uncharacterized protein (TIGR03083 family)
VSTELDQVQVVDALATEFSAISELLAQLSDSDWAQPTACPGWDVHAAVAHMIGTELSLAGVPLPDELPESWPTAHLRNEIAHSNERWIAELAPVSNAELAGKFDGTTTARLAALRALDRPTWDAEGFTPAGKDSYGRFMRIRVFDCWMHEQDIRAATNRPGHTEGPEVDLALDEVATALGFVVGKKAQAPQGTSVRFELTGALSRRIDVNVAERAQVVDRLDGEPTVTLTLPLLTFTRLCGGRADAQASTVQIAGDQELGQRLVDNLGYTI